jgi:hypothetical protein
VLQIGGVDIADQPAKLWVGEVGQLAELAMAQSALGHGGLDYCA